jgi:outer membrane protein OmpA-like peptidoglycan-associated protein
MIRNATFAVVGLFAAITTTGCATKGYVNRKVDQFVGVERGERVATDSAHARDIAAHGTEISALRTDLQSLRNDLQTLRTEFGARITAMEDQVKFAFPVHFGFDDAAVREQDRQMLDRFAKVVQKYYPGAAITVEGFADPAGSSRYNLALSQRRANSVREYLSGQGIGEQAIKAVGYGESRLVRPGATRDEPGAELNRRVVFVIDAAEAGTVTAMAQLPQPQP